MPNFESHKITVEADARPAVVIPRFTIEAVVRKDDGSVVDFTGANSIEFFLRVRGMSREDHKDLVAKVQAWIINRRAGIE